ncbi:BCL2 like 16 [Callorhinchus milii]|nr:BCL2 like 16 [Callorhinchus milii]|eukprot:gi/632977093/ref/XP_007905154.1/ PREDICTED: uncharacterized protein LOC103187455 [Callorhinchus milii]
MLNVQVIFRPFSELWVSCSWVRLPHKHESEREKRERQEGSMFLRLFPAQVSGGPCEDPVVTEAHVMSRDYISFVTGRTTKAAPSPASAALRHAGTDLMGKYPIFFKRWPRIFRDVRLDNACDFLIKILDEHFQPEESWQRKRLTWSGILSIYVLAGQMAIYCQENGMGSVLEELEVRVGQYVEAKVCPDIVDKGGWSGFVERYTKKENAEQSVARGCCGTLLLLSAGLLAYYVYRKRLC